MLLLRAAMNQQGLLVTSKKLTLAILETECWLLLGYYETTVAPSFWCTGLVETMSLGVHVEVAV